MVEIATGYVKPALLVLIPFTWVLGMYYKSCIGQEEGRGAKRLLGRIINDTSRLKGAICLTIVILAMAIGLIVSDYHGPRRIAEAVVIYGLHGAVCVWLATRLYDKVREQ